MMVLHTAFGLIFLDNSLTRWKRIFKKFSIIRNSRISQNSVWKTIFFLGKLHQQLLLYTLITLAILNAEFGLIWTTPWPDEKDLFLKFLLREIQKVLYETPTFFLGKLNQYFMLYTIITLVILNTEFDLIWTTPWPDEKKILKISKIRNSRNSHNSVWKPKFFPRQAIPKHPLLYTLITLVIIHSEFGLVWTTP